jgi:hypothetical protein
MNGDFIQAPWTGEQVDALNRFQRAGDVHEFTCRHDHGGLDRTLYATRDGWRCPHCSYQQDWAHQAMLKHPSMESRAVLPCDVLLPPATIVRKGCELATLMAALKHRSTWAPSENRFDDPIKPEDWQTY